MTSSQLVRVNTKINVHDFDYQWNIQNFRFSCHRPAGKAMNSPIFTIPGTNIKGLLKVYPGGVSERYKDYVSVYLELKNYEDADLIGTLELWIPENDRPGKDSQLVNFSKQEAFGYPEFIERDHLLKSGILVDEELTLMCYLRVSTGVAKSSYIIDEVLNVESCLVKDFEKLLQEKSHTDVTFIVEDERFQAHKLILMARSTYFKKMFTAQSDRNEFMINNITTDCMKSLLQYIYTGKTEVIELSLMDFVKVIWHYELNNQELQEQCEKLLFSQINDENAANLYEFANNYGFYDLFYNCLDYMAKYFSKIICTKSYNNLVKSHPGLVSMILVRVADNAANNSA